MLRRAGLILIVLAVALPLLAQTADNGAPELVATDPDPTIRYPVAHNHAVSGQCVGWLYFSRDRIRYEDVSGKRDSFDFPRSQLERAEQRKLGISLLGLSLKAMGMNYAELKFKNSVAYHFTITRKAVVEKGGYDATRDNLGFKGLLDGANSFPATFALIERAQKPPEPPKPVAPEISVLDPAEALAGRPLEAGTPFRVRGVAGHASGISAVMVNGSPAALHPLAPQSTQFEISDLPLSAGMNQVVISAVATDGAQAQATFQVTRPEVRVLEPTAGASVTSASVRVRGEVRNAKNVQRVDVAGQPARLTAKPDGSTEFEVAAVPLQPGTNTINCMALSAMGQRTDSSVAVTRAQPPGPRSLEIGEVETMLQNGVTKGRVQDLVLKYGVDFDVNAENERRLRAAGADTALLLVIARAKK